MPRKLARPKVRVHVKIDSELFDYFKALLFRPSEGRFGNGFSAIVERLLFEERQRHINTSREHAANGTRADGTLADDATPSP